jgi:hypothetical protein
LLSNRNENVGRFDVAMNNAACMRSIQSIGDLNCDIQEFFRFKRTGCDAVLQGLPFQRSLKAQINATTG